MSGIAGYIGEQHAQRIQQMIATMRHRGPDGQGCRNGDGFSMGQLHLGRTKSQSEIAPLSSPEGNITIVCDGILYNADELRAELSANGRTFNTGDDAEIILRLYQEYGEHCVARLRGAFAFAIYDAENQRLLLARDQMGQKPLFHCAAGDQFAFASEVKGVLAAELLQREMDAEALWHYMSLRYIPDEMSLFQGVRKLPAAHYLVREKSGDRLERYWTPDFTTKRKGSDAELLDALEAELRQAVRLCMRGEERVGSFLSGGIDSGLMTAMMAKEGGGGFPTFSIGVKEQDINELPYARMVSDRYGLDAHAEVVEADLIRKLPTMIHYLDEPADPFGVGVFLVSQVASRYARVVISGDGGDENFAGYDRFAGQRLAGYYGLLPAVLRKQVLGRIFNLVPESFGYKSLASKLRWLNEMSFLPSGERYAHSMSFLRYTELGKRSLFTAAAQRGIQNSDSTAKIIEHFNAPAANELLDRMLYTDLMTRIPDHLLAISDRMAMAHSIEARAPMIDHQITEFAASLPCDFKLRGRKLKYCLRQVALRYLPHELVERPKQGFGFPLARWMRSDLKNFLDTLYRESRFVERGIFEPTELRRLLDEHIGGKADHNFRIWIWINLELWHRMFFEGSDIAALGEFIEARL